MLCINIQETLNEYLRDELIKDKIESTERIKSILQKEILDLKTNLWKNHIHEGEITDCLLSRIADRNNIIRINTLE
jgi:hypothetical protein